MFAIGNDELEELPQLKKMVYCGRCEHKHRIRYGKYEDGETCELLAFIHCDDGEDYLVGINGKDVSVKFKGK